MTEITLIPRWRRDGRFQYYTGGSGVFPKHNKKRYIVKNFVRV